MRSVRRRHFLLTVGAGLAAPAILRARDRKPRLPLSFSTLGCPEWTWKTILGQADTLGYAGIEIRGLEGEMDLTKWPGFRGHRLEESKADLAALGVVVADPHRAGGIVFAAEAAVAGGAHQVSVCLRTVRGSPGLQSAWLLLGFSRHIAR